VAAGNVKAGGDRGGEVAKDVRQVACGLAKWPRPNLELSCHGDTPSGGRSLV
jgi:hypothetical protein